MHFFSLKHKKAVEIILSLKGNLTRCEHVIITLQDGPNISM